MKRSLLLLVLAVFALGFAAVHDTAQDSMSSPPTTTSPSGSLIQMNRIAFIPVDIYRDPSERSAIQPRTTMASPSANHSTPGWRSDQGSGLT